LQQTITEIQAYDDKDNPAENPLAGLSTEQFDGARYVAQQILGPRT
jgi:hypothetical protein